MSIGPISSPRPNAMARIAVYSSFVKRELILMLARMNDWGYIRILDGLKKLGITSPSRNTVKIILKANGLEAGLKRGAGTWDEFLKIHAATLWQCHFYAKKVYTLTRFRELY